MRALLALLTASLLLAATPRSQQPNIVLILADEAAPLSKLSQDDAREGLRALNEGMTTGTLDNERLLRIEADRRFFEAVLSA